jgi:hypothetical protein
LTKPTITRTYGQIHFEDLDPKRFEDLIRQLIYDFKDWQSIEATGRGGADDGFDIRAYERNDVEREPVDDSEEMTNAHPMNGDLWMIQCKREQDLGPIRVRKIIQENITAGQTPPYGYILAVSANVSKKTHDAFREELQTLGVMEFYLWGKAALEDMLFLPKNDRILFTFFGLSLVTKRRSRATEIRAVVSVKNKLLSILGNGKTMHHPILVRDIKDDNYPYEDAYPDFATYPRWKTYTAVEQHPTGLIFEEFEYYAYIDTIKKEYDFTGFVNLQEQPTDDDEEYQQRYKKKELVLDFFHSLPNARHSYYLSYALIGYKAIILVDAKGDNWNERPHVFVDFIKGSPFSRSRQVIKLRNEDIDLEGYKRINIFPKDFTKQGKGHYHEDKIVPLDDDTFFRFSNLRDMTLYATDDRYTDLFPKDIFQIEGILEGVKQKAKVSLSCAYQMTVSDYFTENDKDFELKEKIKLQLGKVPGGKAILNIYELKPIYDYELDQDSE